MLAKSLNNTFTKVVVAFGLTVALTNISGYSQEEKSGEEEIREIIICRTDRDVPEFPGGVEAMYRWLADSITFPPSTANWNGPQRIVVDFDITEEGDAINPRIIKGNSAFINFIRKEIIRVIGKMPKWIPAERNGKPIKSTYTLPFTFRCVDDNEE